EHVSMNPYPLAECNYNVRDPNGNLIEVSNYQDNVA
ncbi:unnamed protein product, partial [marine sediment metagenome]